MRVGNEARAKLLVISDVEQAWASPARRDAPHAPPRPAACSKAPRSLITMSLRLTSIMPLSTSSRIVRDTVSRELPIIWAMVWWVNRRVMRWPSVSSARSSRSWATRPWTSSNTRLPTFSSTRRSRRERDAGRVLEDALKIFAPQYEQRRVLHRDHVRGARLIVDERHLAEELAFAEHRQNHLAAVFADEHDFDLPLGDDVERVTRIVFEQDDGVFGIGTVARNFHHALQIGGGELAEDRKSVV